MMGRINRGITYIDRTVYPLPPYVLPLPCVEAIEIDGAFHAVEGAPVGNWHDILESGATTCVRNTHPYEHGKTHPPAVPADPDWTHVFSAVWGPERHGHYLLRLPDIQAGTRVLLTYHRQGGGRMISAEGLTGTIDGPVEPRSAYRWVIIDPEWNCRISRLVHSLDKIAVLPASCLLSE
jgi:hypothetical protein